jgi:hypothetical protein
VTGEAKLIPESPLVILPSLAIAVGLNEAIVLQQIHYRCRAQREGWWRAPVPELRRDEFPFWSEATIKRVLASLGRQRLVEVRQADGDRANWYRIHYVALGKRVRLPSVQSDPMEGSGCTDPSGQVAPIPIDRKRNSKRGEGARVERDARRARRAGALESFLLQETSA